MGKRCGKTWLLIFILSIGLAASFGKVTARADFGNFAGDSDYGGGSGDSYDGEGGFLDSPWELVGLLIFILILYLATKNSDKAEKAAADRDVQLRPIGEYKELDPGFRESEFRELMSNLYVRMQECWHKKDIESLKPYFTDAFYYQSEKQLDEMRKLRRTPCTERVAVLDIQLTGFWQDSGMDHIKLRLKTRIVAYILDDETGRVVSGDKKREKFMEYEWDLCRKSGVVTGKQEGVQKISCPNCGAPLIINQTAQCPYCDSVVNVVNEDWALNHIKGISQRTQ